MVYVHTCSVTLELLLCKYSVSAHTEKNMRLYYRVLLFYFCLVGSNQFQYMTLVGGLQLVSDDVMASGEVHLPSSIAVVTYSKG